MNLDWIKGNKDIDEAQVNVMLSSPPLKAKSIQPSADLAVRSSRVLIWPDINFPGPDWVSKLTDVRITLTEHSVYDTLALVHFVVSTSVKKADNIEWEDVRQKVNLFKSDGAFVATFDWSWDRGCGKYLFERQFLFTSQVAYPVRNTESAVLTSTWKTRVTWC